MQKTAHKIQCRCGQLEGQLSTGSTMRFVCYCRDCQAYAHALGNSAHVLDERGGTDVIATVQQHLHFTKGVESLACLSLSGRGIYRWYASCCNTPIGNTARDPRLSYIAVVHSCLGESVAALDAEFGTQRIPVNTKRTKGKRGYGTASAMISVARLIGSVVRARMNGSWKNSPFFESGGTRPIIAPQVLDAEERKQAYDAVDAERDGAGTACSPQ
jgi:hypothetical protein